MSDSPREAAEGGGSTRAEQKARTRQAILDAAAEAYAESGSGAGIITIAERAGVHHSTVLFHFGTVHGLQMAVLQERDRHFFAENVGEEWTGGGWAALLNLPAVARWALAHPHLAKLFCVLEVENADAAQPLHDYFLGRQRVIHDLLVAMMEGAVADGDMREDVDLGAKADEIIAFQTGAHVMWALDPERVQLLDLFESYTGNLRAELSRPRRKRG